MAQEISDLIPAVAAADPAEPGGLSRSGSASRLNAQAPEFVPRAAAAPPPTPPSGAPPVIHVFAAPPPPPAFFAAPPPPPPPFEYYAAVGGGRGGFAAAEHEAEAEHASPPQPAGAAPTRDGLSDEVVQKITKQVEYYFSDINLATTEHLMRFISKDLEGNVPISVIAGFKKIKALVHNNTQLATALRTSSKLVVSDDGKKVRRQQPFTEADVEELQSRIVVAENLPEDHCYQNLMKVFSVVGSVRTIRTCYPQTQNGTAPVTNRSAKLDMLFANKLHAFVEYETVEDAEKAIAELNDERNWRSGLRVRLLNTCMTKGAGKGKKGGHEGDGNGEDDDASTSNQPNEKQLEDSSLPLEMLHEHVAEESPSDKDKDAGTRRGRGRGRGGRGRGRGYQHNNSHHNNHHNNRGGAHPVGTPPASHPTNVEQPLGANKQPPGPRMPDGTRGFSMGRGKPQISPSLSTNVA